MSNEEYREPLFCERWIPKLLKIIDTLPEGNHTIAIDGRCASGKTTFAGLLANTLNAGVVHMDDFFLPKELRTAERLRQPGGNVHYERFLKEVMPNLNQGIPFSYQKFDCSRMELGAECELQPSRFTIVEGAYSCHPLLGDYMSLRVFIDVDTGQQQERIEKRNGAEKLAVFLKRWIPMEEAYFSEFGIAQKADIILCENR